MEGGGTAVVKEAGAVLLLLGGGLLGRTICQRWLEREKALSGWLRTLDRWQGELTFRTPELSQLLALGEEVLDPLDLTRLGELPFSQLWREALKKRPLTAEDRRLLESLGTILGRYGPEEQVRLLSGVRAEVEDRLRALRRERRERGRVVLTLCFSLGTLLVILFW